MTFENCHFPYFFHVKKFNSQAYSLFVGGIFGKWWT